MAFSCGFTAMAENIGGCGIGRVDEKNRSPLASFQSHAGRCAGKARGVRKQLEADLDPSADRRGTNLFKKLFAEIKGSWGRRKFGARSIRRKVHQMLRNLSR
jgi:hypothetical protein